MEKITLNTIYNEPCLKTISKMDNESIDCVITSPPYWQLRDYGYDGQWGLEPTYNEYLEHLWSLMDGLWRVLKSEGTCWINMGDTYGTKSGSMGNGTFDPKNPIASNTSFEQTATIHKCLLLIPHRFAIGCIDRGWILRNDIIWAKRNGMPESVRDRFSKKHEFFFFFVKQEKYFFDLNAIKDKPGERKSGDRFGGKKYIAENGDKFIGNTGIYVNEGTKNPGDVADFWDVPTKPSSNEHYASYNDSLLVKPVLAGCPKEGVIYDPFMGTGSTAEVALRSGRNYIGSEMSKKYIDIAEKRLLPFKLQKTLF